MNKIPKTIQIGQKIRHLRDFKNITRESMADQLDMSLSGYSKIERDEVDLSLGKLDRIANILEMNLSTLITLDEKLIFNDFLSPPPGK